MREEVRQQALRQKIARETFADFSERVTTTLNNFPITEIGKTIESKNKRLPLIKGLNGETIKY